MILGTGTDIVDIKRFQEVFERHETRFISRSFTGEEQKTAEKRRPNGLHVAAYAKRFAAKEACSKALGTGFAEGVLMRDIGVVNKASGMPSISLTGGAKERLDAMVPEGMIAKIHLTMTDEAQYAKADVIIEAVSIP